MRKIVDKINALEPTISALGDADLSAKTEEFKQRYNKGESLDKLLPEAFAVCREAAKLCHGHASLRCTVDRWHYLTRR
ncbi:hypothetical protein PYR78_15885 [Acinetobacter johnsonii]|nr:hypothetical protein PYR78_15885 [Acinetobacter johnsonii]